MDGEPDAEGGAPSDDGPCVLPRGHNMGRLDIPEHHERQGAKPLSRRFRDWLWAPMFQKQVATRGAKPDNEGCYKPLGVDDLYAAGMLIGPLTPDYYVWCRAHERARKNTERCRIKCICGSFGRVIVSNKEHDDRCPQHTRKQIDCILVGPFMSEREANRLGGGNYFDVAGRVEPSLGMEIDR